MRKTKLTRKTTAKFSFEHLRATISGLRKVFKTLFLLSIITFSQTVYSQTKTLNEKQAQGKVLAFERSKGNCLACHVMEEGELPGNAGPPLVMMKLRFPDKSILRQQIWDATIKNPKTIMPPFGRHGILTEKEIDAVVDYVYSL